MYAVVATGGKQYRVEAGGELTIERVDADAGASITFDRILLVGDGDAVTVGTPTIDGAKVSATVLGEALGPKLTVFKFKQKVKYRRMAGHRQHLLRVRIDEISADGRSSRADTATDEPTPARRKRASSKRASSKDETATTTAAAEAKPARAARKPKAATDAATEADANEPKPKRPRRTSAKADEAGAADAGAAGAKPKRTRAAKKDTAKAEE